MFVSEFGGESLAQGRSAMNEEETPSACTEQLGTGGPHIHDAVVHGIEFVTADT